ncbi:MAG: hypothetical protein AAF624_11670 [Bacteroidota bacterium]
MRPLAFVFLLASLVLTGCDFVSSGSDSSGTTVTGITFDQLPLARGNGDSWDEDGAPDVYLEIQDALGRVYVGSAAPVEITELGVRVPVEGTIRNLDREYFMFVVDLDENGPDEDMGNIARISFTDAVNARASQVTFENETATLKVTLDLQYDEPAAE